MDEEEGEEKSFLERINPNSLGVVHGFVEVAMKDAKPLDQFQFFRHGYFNVDPKYTDLNRLVYNRIVSLKSSFSLEK